MLKLAISLLVFGTFAQAAIPPVGVMLKEVFQGRKSGPGMRIVFKHRISLTKEKVFVIEETMVHNAGRTFHEFKVLGSTAPMRAEFKQRVYALDDGRKISSKSVLFRRYFLAKFADEFQRVLMAERFLRPDQLKLYKEGFTPEGDPRSWDLKANLIQHNDIFLSRRNRKIAIAVFGTQTDTLKRSFHVARSLRGFSRFEWADSGQTVAWTFDQYQKFGGAYYPKRLTFEVGAAQVVTSDLVHLNLLTSKQLTAFLRKWRASKQQTAVHSNNARAALNLLLSYR